MVQIGVVVEIANNNLGLGDTLITPIQLHRCNQANDYRDKCNVVLVGLATVKKACGLCHSIPWQALFGYFAHSVVLDVVGFNYPEQRDDNGAYLLTDVREEVLAGCWNRLVTEERARP